MRRPLENDRTCFHIALISWALAAVGMIWAISFCVSAYRAALQEAREYQKDKAQEIATQLRSYFYVATQLAESLEVFVERYNGRDPRQMEQLLDSFLASAPRNFIYGIGIWFEPYAFDATLKHFGPYAYRPDPNGPRVLTYEWSTTDYDYHSQFWYKAVVEPGADVFITDPYVARNRPYISLVKPFRGNGSGQKKGVISVDVVVAQMQTVLAKLETRPHDQIMIVGSSGRLIAHSQADELFAHVREQHPERALRSILDLRIGDAMEGVHDHLTHESFLTKLGWKVVIISQADELMQGYRTSRRIIAMATLVYLLIIALAYTTISYFLRSLEKQRETFLYTEKMASLGEMAGSIAHEINNPLAVIQGAAQKLQIRLRHEEWNRDEVKQTAALIVKTAERIALIIRSLRFVARDGRSDPFVSSSVRSIVEETLALCEARVKGEGIMLDASAVPADLYCVCRAVQISQILINLINNAVDALAEQNEKWVRLEAWREDGWIRLAVTDSGPGIPHELVTEIMKPFFTTKAVGKGTGLGLSIARGIAEAHGGHLRVDERSPHTRFVLSLPEAQARRQTA